MDLEAIEKGNKEMRRHPLLKILNQYKLSKLYDSVRFVGLPFHTYD